MSEQRLARRLGLVDAVTVGLGAMLGTGVFVVWSPAAAQAGSLLLVSLLLAALVAAANGLSTAELAALHPESGGAYAYGRARLGRTAGALAGYAFVVGKTASCAVAALAVGVYAWPERQQLVAVGVTVAAVAVDRAGVHRTAAVTRVLVVVLVAVLAAVVAVGLPAGSPTRLTAGTPPGGPGSAGLLAAAALLFYAFAGYARIATLGEEVRDPARTIPRAVVVALGIVLVVYAAVAVTALSVLGPTRLAASAAPLADVVRAAGAPVLLVVVRVGGAVAATSALLSLLVGLSRTTFAMAARGDLPRALAAVHPRSRVPSRAGLAVGAVTVVVVLAGGLTGVLALSAFTVLTYYAVANLAALRLGPGERRVPPLVPAFGLLACAVLALSLPWRTVLLGSTVLASLLLLRALTATVGRRQR